MTDEEIKTLVTNTVKTTVTDSIKTGLGDVIKPLIQDAVKPLSETVKTLGDNQKVLGDTLAKLPPAGVEKKEGDDAGNTDAAKSLTADDIKKLVADGVAAAQTAQQQTADQKAAREKFVNDPVNGIAKLPSAYKAQLGNDPAKWADEAKALKTDWETFAKDNKIPIPDVGGAAREGGDASGSGDASKAKPKFNNLTEGEQKFADGIKLPGQTAPANTTPAASAA